MIFLVLKLCLEQSGHGKADAEVRIYRCKLYLAQIEITFSDNLIITQFVLQASNIKITIFEQTAPAPAGL